MHQTALQTSNNITAATEWDSFSQNWVKCSINICWITGNIFFKFSSRSWLSSHTAMHSHSTHAENPLYFIYIEQTDLSILWSNFAVYIYFSYSSLWEIETGRLSNCHSSHSSQEAPEWNESTNRMILHPDEYAFVPAYAFSSPTSLCDF